MILVILWIFFFFCQQSFVYIYLYIYLDIISVQLCFVLAKRSKVRGLTTIKGFKKHWMTGRNYFDNKGKCICLRCTCVKKQIIFSDKAGQSVGRRIQQRLLFILFHFIFYLPRIMFTKQRKKLCLGATWHTFAVNCICLFMFFKMIWPHSDILKSVFCWLIFFIFSVCFV